MTGLRVSFLGAVALLALFAGAVALYASDNGHQAGAQYSTAPYHVQKAMGLNTPR